MVAPGVNDAGLAIAASGPISVDGASLGRAGGRALARIPETTVNRFAA
jgi:hypothetical protein